MSNDPVHIRSYSNGSCVSRFHSSVDIRCKPPLAVLAGRHHCWWLCLPSDLLCHVASYHSSCHHAGVYWRDGSWSHHVVVCGSQSEGRTYRLHGKHRLVMERVDNAWVEDSDLLDGVPCCSRKYPPRVTSTISNQHLHHRCHDFKI